MKLPLRQHKYGWVEDANGMKLPAFGDLDLAEIVRRVNAHDKLVEALLKIVALRAEYDGDCPLAWDRFSNIAQAVLVETGA